MQQPWPNGGFANADDIQACHDLIKQGSRSFHAASKLLPKEVREPAFALYAFCRIADDTVDESQDGFEGVAQLDATLNRCYAGCPAADPIERALADVVMRFAIPRKLMDALLEGLAWDVENRRYEDLSALTDYAVRVAGTVGGMMALLMGVRQEDLLARALDLGIAMQFTNIARDVGEDARNGRLYLPLDWLEEAGVDPDAWLKNPVFDARIKSVVERLLAEAKDFYQRALPGIDALPLNCRPGIHAASMIYAEIGQQLRRQGYNSIDKRAVVPTWRKVHLLAGASAASMIPLLALSLGRTAPPAAEGDFLVAAAAQSAPAMEPWWNVPARTARVVDLFYRLEERDRLKTRVVAAAGIEAAE